MKAIVTGLGALCVLAAAAAPTFAADMYRAPDTGGYKDGPAYAGVNWTGLYAGLNAGGAWSSDSVPLNGLGGSGWAPYYPDPLRTRTLDGSGFSGGAQIGYNRQFDTVVAGIEADISGLSGGANLKESGAGFNSPYTLNLIEKLDWLATVRGRLGFVAAERTLLYATGGLAFGDVSTTSKLDFTNSTQYDAAGSETKVGWVLGGGVEHALAANWSLKAEYLYYDLGKSALIATPSPANGPYQTSTSFENNGSIVRGGINYHLSPSYEPLK